MTETSPISFQSSVDEDLDHRVSTVGRVQPHVEVKIVDEAGRTTPIGVQGELLTRGYSVMRGYWGDRGATREAIVDGWMRTGDLATIDARGYADFAPLGHSVRALREEAKGTISWRIEFRDGRVKNFVSPIRTTPWGSIPSPADLPPPSGDAMQSQELAHEPDALNIASGLPALAPDQLKQGVV